MPAFNAASVVEPLDYAFDTCDGQHEGSCWRGSEKEPRPAKCTVFVPGCHGTVREPNDRQVADYLAGYQKLLREYRGQLPDAIVAGGNPDISAVMDAAAELDPEIILRLNTDVAALIAALCSNEPSKDDILGLPPRIRAMFCGWVQKEAMSPEAVKPAGSGQARNLRSVAAG